MDPVTEEELRSLSGLSTLAFAARCAERAWPAISDSYTSKKDKLTLRSAIDLVIDFAGGRVLDNSSMRIVTNTAKAATEASNRVIEVGIEVSKLANKLIAEADEAERELEIDISETDLGTRAGGAADDAAIATASAHAAQAAVFAIQAAAALASTSDKPGGITFCAGEAAKASTLAAVRVSPATAIAARLDFQYLLGKTGVIQIENMGPLWPVKAAKFFGGSQNTHLESPCSLSFILDPGDASAELIEEFYFALSAYYRSIGGSGIRFTENETRSVAGELV